MKPASLTAIALAASLLFSIHPNLHASSATTKFDGKWTAVVNFREYKDPSGSVARAAVVRFPVVIKEGFLQGEWQSTKTPGWFKINGKIAADGAAILNMHGAAGSWESNLKDNTTEARHAREGTLYGFEVKAQFDAQRGTGKRIGGVRQTDFDFVKD